MTSLRDGRRAPEASAARPSFLVRRSDPLPPPGRFAGWAILCVLAIVYVSVVVSPAGFLYMPHTLADAWHQFISIRYVPLGSDQQSDWMANLLMFILPAFLIAGAVWPRRATGLGWAAAILALAISVALVIVIKFAQIYFPRTVTLNYILAQSLGSLIGVTLFGLGHRRLFGAAHQLTIGGPRAYHVMLIVYSVALFLYFLFPFDFTWTQTDFVHRIASVPRLFLTLPGEGRSFVLRIILLALGTAATMPFGMLIAARSQRMSLGTVAVVGLVTMAGVTALATFVQSATPSLAWIGFRTIGIVAGAALQRRVGSIPLSRWQPLLTRAVPFAALPYVFAVFVVNDVHTTGWQNLHALIAHFDTRALIPFWNYYIVSKSQAVASLVVHALMYAPIGMMIWLRHGGGKRATTSAVCLAFLFAALMETCRWLQTGYSPDISDAFVAAAAAALAVKLMPALFRVAQPATVAKLQSSTPHLASAEPSTPRAIPEADAGPSRARTAPAAWAVAIALIVLDGVVVARYPLYPGVLAVAIALYGACLWRWPGAWLVIIPAAWPVFNLAPWTGWAFVDEPDLLIVMTIAVLAVRVPVTRQDVLPSGFAGTVVAIYTLTVVVALAIGLSMAGPAGGSDNPYLEPQNALRLAKGLLAALLLWPFLRQRLRTQGDAVIRFGVGVIVGLGLEGLVVLLERALFPGVLDFSSDYRVVGTFFSMHFGGGYIGAYLAMSLPFLVAGLRRPRPAIAVILIAVATVAGYALVVSFARTAYAAALIGMVTTALFMVLAARRTSRPGAASVMVPTVLLAVLGTMIAVATLDSRFMVSRFETVRGDLGTRENNWTGGLALRDRSLVADMLGMGLGSYPRVALERTAPTDAPSNFVIRHANGDSYLSLTPRSSFYLVQRVPAAADQAYWLNLKVRAPSAGAKLSVALCENALLYSYNCRGSSIEAPRGPKWQSVTIPIQAGRRDGPTVLGFIQRPTILSLSDPARATTIEITDVRLVDQRGRTLTLNGNFADGLDHWLFTDDDHLVWRIKNQYLMTLFEGGAVGLGAFILLVGAALVGAIRATGIGNDSAAAVVGSLAAFLCSCAFDYVLEAPPISALFYLVVLIGLAGFSNRGREA